jgi:hypothetical protein
MSNKEYYKEHLTDDKDKECIKKFESKIRKYIIKKEKETLKNDINNLKKEGNELNKKDKLTKEEERKKSSIESTIKYLTSFLNDKERFNKNVNNILNTYILALCNHTCKGTVFAIGDKKRIPESWKQKLGDIKFLEDNPGFEKFYLKIRKKYYSGESFTKNTVTEDEKKIMKKVGLLSYCEGPGMREDIGNLLKKMI